MREDLEKQNDAPEPLYHVKRTIIDFPQDKSGAAQATDIICTFTDLAAAKAAARSALPREGYSENDFVKYEENYGNKVWKHGDGAMVFAKAPAGQECGIQTTEVGSYPTRKAAREAAHNSINEEVTKESFDKYNEKGEERDDWPHGDDVLIYAVTEAGKNIKISVEAQPHSRQHHVYTYHEEKSE
jgi:hypothetical protein